VFLYARVLGVELEPMGEIERAKAPQRRPVVLSRGEVRAVLDRMTGVPGLVCWLLYGAGLRLDNEGFEVECAPDGRLIRLHRGRRTRRSSRAD